MRSNTTTRPSDWSRSDFWIASIRDSGRERDVFYVKDNGIGIDPEFHQEIFRIFKRLQMRSTSRTPAPASASPLSRRSSNATAAGSGSNSEPGKGTVFYFNLNRGRNEPARNAHERAIEPIPVHPAGRGQPGRLRGHQPGFQESQSSNPIVWCKSGRDALDFLKREGAYKERARTPARGSFCSI